MLVSISIWSVCLNIYIFVCLHVGVVSACLSGSVHTEWLAAHHNVLVISRLWQMIVQRLVHMLVDAYVRMQIARDRHVYVCVCACVVVHARVLVRVPACACGSDLCRGHGLGEWLQSRVPLMLISHIRTLARQPCLLRSQALFTPGLQGGVSRRNATPS